jgi:hypothetical protein
MGVVESVSGHGLGDNDRGGDTENATPINPYHHYASLPGAEIKDVRVGSGRHPSPACGVTV